MSISWLVTNLLATFLLPPANGLLLMVVGWRLARRYPRLGRAAIVVGAALIAVLSLPVVGDTLLRGLEDGPLRRDQMPLAQAIVVLGAGRYRDAPEFGGDTVGEGALSRLRYAARLHRESGLPILVSGGRPDGGQLSEAEAMARALTDEFLVPVRWCEDGSDNTAENARRSAALLTPEGIDRVLLVTHAWHMPRARRAFEAAGLTVIPAATQFHEGARTPLDFLPQAEGLGRSRQALHEWIGLLWYGLRR